MKKTEIELSLFTPRGQGLQWIYLWGDVDAYLLARVRKEAFLGCYDISHPGFFPKFNHLLHARRQFELKRLPASARIGVYHSGDIRLMVNDIRVLHEPMSEKPVRREVDLLPVLRKGLNKIYLYCSRIDQPPCLLIDGDVLRTEGQWTIGRDEMHQEPPACYAFVDNGLFPHQERLPESVIEPQRTIRPHRGGEIIFDFGKEVFGYPEIETARPARIVLQPGETLAESQERNEQNWEQHCPPLVTELGEDAAGETPARRMGGTPMPPETAMLRETAGETPATRNATPATARSEQPLAMRYLHVQTSEPADVKCRLHAPLYPATCRGSFECSDERLNRIWQVAADTLHLGMREFLLDGIKRDRLPWVGDAYIGGLANAYTFAEWPVLERTLTAAYGESPQLTFPNNLLVWALTWVLAMDTYRLYAGETPARRMGGTPMPRKSAGETPATQGNTEFLSRSREKLTDMMTALADHEDPAGLLVGDEKAWAWVDWAQIETDGAVAAIQMLYVMVLEAAANLAEHWNDSAAAKLWRSKARKLRSVAQKAFWSAERQAFVASVRGNTRSKQITRHANFLAILSGVATKSQQKAILSLLDDPNIPAVTTPHMKFWEARARHLAGDTKGMIDTLHRYWGGMVDLGATTFWEDFNPAHKGRQHYAFYGRPFGKSLCHVWATGAIYLLSADVLGVRPTASGFSRFTVTPNLAGIEWARGTIPTPAGLIEVEVRKGRVRVKSPKGIRQDEGRGA